MVVVFISNYYNHHQSSFCKAMYQLTNGNFYFIATETINKARLGLGWKQEDLPVFVKQIFLNDKLRKECQKLIDVSDVVITASSYNKYIHKRLLHGKMTFRYTERLIRKESFIKLIGYSIRELLFSRFRSNLYMLCASAFASYDYHRMHSFQGKCYKWGYFPPIRRYESIEKIMQMKKKTSVLWVARLLELKHPEVALQLAYMLHQNGYSIELNLIGVGPLQRDLEKIVEEKRMGQYVHLLGSMSTRDVRNHMEKNEIFLFTSNKEEGWGAVLNEAMNSGCTVVASSAIGSVPFLVKNNENGIIYKDGDIDDLFNKVKWLLDNPDQREKIGVNAYNTINSSWNAEEAASRLINLIEKLQKHENTPYLDGPCSIAEIICDNYFDRII